MEKPEKRTIRETDKLLRMYDKGFNHGIADMEAYYEDYGNKKIGLDLGKIKEILKSHLSHLSHVLPWKSEQIDMIILALKDREDEIIVEVK